MLSRLASEFGGLARTLDPRSYANYLAATIVAAPEVIKSRQLLPADRRMRGVARFKTWGEDLVIECGAIDRLVGDFDASVVFSLARELCGRNVYFRAFEPFDARGQLVLDLGANRGVFTALAHAAITPEQVISVEPQSVYAAAFGALVGDNLRKTRLVNAFAGANACESLDDGLAPVCSVPELIGDRSVAFLKADIEGAEEQLFTADAVWARQIQRLAMESHPRECDTVAVCRTLEGHGLTVFPSDAVGRRSSPDSAEFIYAAREPAMLAAAFRH